MFNRFLKRKHKGSVDGFIVMLLGVVVLFGCLMFYIYTVDASNVSAKVGFTVRKYMLVLESKGYLDSNDQNNLKSDLTKLGMKNISLFGSTLSKASYGSSIQIKITGVFDLRTIGLSSNSAISKLERYNFEETYCTISKN